MSASPVQDALWLLTAKKVSLSDMKTTMLNCGDCPGAAIVPRLAQVNLWNKPMEEPVNKVHIATCIVDHCPHKDIIIEKVKAKSGVEVILGSHPYILKDIFA